MSVSYQIALIGGVKTGKHTGMIRLISSHFVDEYDPTLHDGWRKSVVIDDEAVLLSFLYTASPEVKDVTREQYTRMADGFLLFYSTTERKSFDAVPKMIDEVRRVKDTDELIPMVLNGSKVDLHESREVATADGVQMAQFYSIPFFETSALSGENIEECYYEVVREIRKKATIFNLKKKKTKGCVLM